MTIPPNKNQLKTIWKFVEAVYCTSIKKCNSNKLFELIFSLEITQAPIVTEISQDVEIWLYELHTRSVFSEETEFEVTETDKIHGHCTGSQDLSKNVLLCISSWKENGNPQWMESQRWGELFRQGIGEKINL